MICNHTHGTPASHEYVRSINKMNSESVRGLYGDCTGTVRDLSAVSILFFRAADHGCGAYMGASGICVWMCATLFMRDFFVQQGVGAERIWEHLESVFGCAQHFSCATFYVLHMHCPRP